MRRITTAITAAALSLSMALSLNMGVVQATTPGYDSAYQFESAFLSLKPGDSGTFSVFFANTGTTSWVVGSGTQVNLGICAADKVTCNVTSAQAAWANGWLSSTAYATSTKSAVAPGDFSAFTYNVKVPTGQAGGVYRFNGDLVLGSTGDRIHPEGYYQDANISGAAGGGSALSITPDYPANEDNEVSTTVPGNGQHTYTINTTLTGTLTLATMTSGNIVRNSDGTFSFCDENQDKKADGVGSANSVITAINGTSISSSNVVINQPIPSNGTMTVTVDSSVRNTRTRLIAWQDKNNNAQIDLTAAGDVNCDTPTPYDSTTDGAMAISGRKFWFGPQGQFGAQDSGCPGLFVYRHDSANQVFSAGTSIATSLRYNYDSNDIFQILGTQVSLATFKSELTASNSDSTHADQVHIAYDPNPAGISTFNICINKGADAPTDLTAAVGNFDSGTGADDVRLTFTSPAVNTVLNFNVQRATKASDGTNVTAATCTPLTSPNPNGSGTTPPSDGTAGNPPNANFSTVGATSTPGNSETATFTNFDLAPVTAPGGYCYRVQVTNPNTGANSYSNYVFVPITSGAPTDTTAPTSSFAELSSSSGFANTLDQGDKLDIEFTDNGPCTSCGMSIAPNATIRVTDSDCGTPTGWPVSQNGAPASCTGGNTNTVADIICGTNATCTTNNFGGQTNAELVVTMTGNPSIVAAGSVAGSQYPIVVTDSSGITDASGNSWNFTGSTDRIFGPAVGQ
jgi:hypothetical protein